MVVEHVFVTTAEAGPTLVAAEALLHRHGFTAVNVGGFAIDAAAPTTAEYVRKGTRQAFRLSRVLLSTEQKVRIDYDRGRVTVAAALQNLAADLGKAGRAVVGGRMKKPVALQTEWLMALARSLEASIARGEPTDSAEGDMIAARIACHEYARRKTRNTLVTMLVLIVGIVALVTMAVQMS